MQAEIGNVFESESLPSRLVPSLSKFQPIYQAARGRMPKWNRRVYQTLLLKPGSRTRLFRPRLHCTRQLEFCRPLPAGREIAIRLALQPLARAECN